MDAPVTRIRTIVRYMVGYSSPPPPPRQQVRPLLPYHFLMGSAAPGMQIYLCGGMHDATSVALYFRGRTHTKGQMDKLGSYPYGSCTPNKARSHGCHFRDYGSAQNKLLKPGQVLAGALSVAPVLVVWAPEVPPGPPLVIGCYDNHNQWFCPP